MRDTVGTIKVILQLAAVATLVLGMLTLFWPELLISWFDADQQGSNHFVRFIGAALIGFAATDFLYSKMSDFSSLLPAVYGNLTSLGLAVMVDLGGLWTHNLDRSAWLILAVHLAFACAFAYCALLVRKIKGKEGHATATG